MSDAAFLELLPAEACLVSTHSARRLKGADIGLEVRRRAFGLSALGLAHGDRVVVGEHDPLDYLLAILACWTAGLAAVAVNPLLSPAEQGNVVASTRAGAWLGETALAFAPSVPAGATSPLSLNEPALILMTSGTTGRPKGIVHTQATLLRRACLNIEAIGVDALRHTLCVLPVFFGHGLIGNVLTPLLAGGTVHLWPGPALAELPRLPGYLDDNTIGFMSSVPSFWKIALRVASAPALPLARIQVGSAPLTIELWRSIARWGGTDNVLNMFGMTETANWIAGGALSDPAAATGFVGRAWGGELAVRTDAGAILSAGRGEVLVRSPSIMLGYWERPDLDAESFVDGWFCTGDTGQLSADGSLTLLGRIKTEINRGGIKVLAEEVDMLLERHPDIVEACAFGIPDPVAGELVAAAIVMNRGVAFEPEAIKSWCRAQARADAVPARLHSVAAIPRNDRGKIVRADVRRLVGG